MLLFSSVFVRPFLTKAHQRKASEYADGLRLWLHTNLQKYVAAAVKERSVIFHPLATKKYMKDERSWRQEEESWSGFVRV